MDPAGGFMPSARFTVTHQCSSSTPECVWHWEATLYVAPAACPATEDNKHIEWVEPTLHIGSGTATETTQIVAPKLESMVVLLCIYVDSESVQLVGQSSPIPLT